jgi:hypothetical protein
MQVMEDAKSLYTHAHAHISCLSHMQFVVYGTLGSNHN